MNWQPMTSAPTDRPIVVTDGKIYGLAYLHVHVEPEKLGSDFYGFRPNPDAGKVRNWWFPHAGWTVWEKDEEWEEGEYEQCGPRRIEPTHWSESPPTPPTPPEKHDG